MAKSNLCCRCHNAQRRLTSSYCLQCQNQRKREYLASLSPEEKRLKCLQWAEERKRRKEKNKNVINQYEQR